MFKDWLAKFPLQSQKRKLINYLCGDRNWVKTSINLFQAIKKPNQKPIQYIPCKNRILRGISLHSFQQSFSSRNITLKINYLSSGLIAIFRKANRRFFQSFQYFAEGIGSVNQASFFKTKKTEEITSPAIGRVPAAPRITCQKVSHPYSKSKSVDILFDRDFHFILPSTA